ncbi:hypothetical protein EQ500_07990 [Lactobacillus sp. XV13L]|nr:hypothetical protein [Lactobacillus sp. XV13L]
MAKKYMSQHTRTRHTYRFFKERRNDPRWHDDYVRVHSLRTRSLVIQAVLLTMLITVGYLFWQHNFTNQSNSVHENRINSAQKSKINQKEIKNTDQHRSEQLNGTQHQSASAKPKQSEHRQEKLTNNQRIVQNFLINTGYQIEPILFNNEPITQAMDEGKAPQNSVHDGLMTVYFVDSSAALETFIGTYNPKFKTQYHVTENELVIGKHHIPYSISNNHVYFRNWVEGFENHKYTYKFTPDPNAKEFIDSKPNS